MASNNSIKELPSPFPEQFSVHISCPLRKGSSEGRRCSKGVWQESWDVELPRSFTCQWWGMSCCQQVCMTLLFVSWKASAQACAFFTDIFEGFSCSRDKYGTPEGQKDFEALPEMCYRNWVRRQRAVKDWGEFFFSTKLAYIFIPSLHLYLQRENPSLLKDYVIKMLAGLTTDYLHVSIAMTLCRALYYSLQGIYCTSAFLKLSNCLGNPLICFLLVTM